MGVYVCVKMTRKITKKWFRLVCVCLFMYVCMHVFVCMHVYACVGMCEDNQEGIVNAYLTREVLKVMLYMHVYVYTHTNIYTYIHIHVSQGRRALYVA